MIVIYTVHIDWSSKSEKLSFNFVSTHLVYNMSILFYSKNVHLTSNKAGLKLNSKGKYVEILKKGQKI